MSWWHVGAAANLVILVAYQGLASAKLAFDLDGRDRGMAALEQTLGAARRIITDLLSGPGDTAGAGALQRDRPAGGSAR